jgi:hypothetical protein
MIFQVDDWVLKWDTLRQDKGKHNKFDSLWTGPFMITQVQHNSTFILQSLGGEEMFGGPVNGQFMNSILSKAVKPSHCNFSFSLYFYRLTPCPMETLADIF